MELAQLELKQKATNIGVGVGLLIAAALFGFFAIWFGLAAGAAGIATALPTWAALLIVFGALLLLAGILAGVGGSLLQKGAPPVPEQAIEEAKLTQSALKGDG
jgi:membrane protein implicated in regulation of membrane protease activity